MRRDASISRLVRLIARITRGIRHYRIDHFSPIVKKKNSYLIVFLSLIGKLTNYYVSLRMIKSVMNPRPFPPFDVRRFEEIRSERDGA